MSTIRPFDLDRDKEQGLQTWRDAGWIGDKSDEGIYDAFVEDADGIVAEVNGRVEVLCLRNLASVRYLAHDVPASLIAAVTAGRPARGQGMASRCSARLVADAAVEGAILSYLGVFDLGYYDKLGFGTGSPMTFLTIDPVSLNCPRLTRAPVRLTKEDAAEMHARRLHRERHHGSINFPDLSRTRAEMASGSFGLGFRDDAGTLTHHMWVKEKGEHGPYRIKWMVYENAEQLHELLSVVASWRDQVHGVRFYELPDVQMHDLIRTPFAHWRRKRKGEFDPKPESFPWWQGRINDVPAAIAHSSIRDASLRFVLDLTDPIAHYLDDHPWQGVAGTYIIELGSTSTATRTTAPDPSLPVLSTSVNAFTRLWLGVAKASSLSRTTDLKGSAELLASLDELWQVPTPMVDWDM